MEDTFEALASTARRKILACLAEGNLTAGEIASFFDMSKPAISKHLRVLQNANLISREKKGQYIIYSLNTHSLTNQLNSFLQEVCPVSRNIKNKRKKAQK